MKHGEYWLYETVVEYRVPLLFLDHPEIEVLFNKPSHGLDRSELFATLRTCFDRGDFFAHQDSRGTFIPNDAELETSLVYLPPKARAHSISYGLTAAGGQRWESIAATRWDRFLYEDYGDQDMDGDGEIIAADESLIAEFLTTLPYVGIHIDPASIAWETLEPWPATYWKTLPLGRRIRFHYHRTEFNDWSRVPAAYHALRKWYSPPLL